MNGRIQQKSLLVWSVSFIVLLWPTIFLAQNLPESEATLAERDSETTDVFEEVPDAVTVSESRLKPRPFVQRPPLQVKTAVVDREAGLLNAAKELQKATQARKNQVVQRLKFVGSVSAQSPVRSTFNSASPIQIISAQDLRESGLVRAKDIFQRTYRQVDP